MSLWHDEVVTITRFASGGPRAIFFGDYIPNNHMLFNLLTWFNLELGVRREVAYRFWGAAPALAAVIGGCIWLARRADLRAAVAFLILTTVHPLLAIVSREARGYGLAMLFVGLQVAFCIGALTRLESDRRRYASAVVAAGLLGIWTLPVLVLPFIAICLVLLADSFLRRHVVGGLAIAGALSFAWYLPKLDRLIESTSEQFGSVLPWHGFLSGPFERLVFPMFRFLLPGSPNIHAANHPDPIAATIVWYVLGAGLIGLGIVGLSRRWSPLAAAVLWLPVLLTFLALTASRIWVVDRFLSFLGLPMVALMAAGAAEVLRFPQRSRLLGLPAAAGMSSAFAVLLISTLPAYDR